MCVALQTNENKQWLLVMNQEDSAATSSLVTIVVVQRERFSTTRRSLESLYRETRQAFDLIYVDGGSPRRIARYLTAQASRRGFLLIQLPYHLPPHCARNMAAALASTRYVVFVDNDVIFSPGWLDALVACAEATGADAVTPLICIGEPLHGTVHLAGGTARIVEEDGRRRFEEVMRFDGRPLKEVKDQLKREATGLVEFHCVLIRRSVFERFGALDEAYLASSEHLDLALTLNQRPGSIFFEPSAVITYLPPPPLALGDLPYYTLRWSDEWTVASEEHFYRKWNAEFNDRIVRFAKEHRRQGFQRLRRAMLATVGWRRSQRFSDWLDATLIAIAKRRGSSATAEASVRNAENAAPARRR